MGRILKEMLLLLSSTPVTSDELQARTEAFTKYLFNEGVPEDQLEAAYARAMKGRRSTYPMVATEWLTGYELLQAETVHASPCVHCLAHLANPTLPECPFHKDGGTPATGDLRGTEVKFK